MFYGWKPYVSAAARRQKAERARARLEKSGKRVSPVAAYRGAIAKSFWGKSWCANLERYSDYSNRLPRGRTYLRNGSVIDLQIAAGAVAAQVMGSSLYKVAVTIAAVPSAHWAGIAAECAQSIDSLVELLQGQLSQSVMERMTRPGTGLLPAPKEIKFTCSCPDSASMCKHIAATLYGIGARLDSEPELLFTLRKVDAQELIVRAGEAGLSTKKGPRAGRVLDSGKLADVFGIDMANAQISPPKVPGRRAATKKQAARKKAVIPVKKRTRHKIP